MSAKPSTRREATRPSYDIQVRAIKSATNPRNPLSPSLQDQGWDCMAGDKQIWNLAVSDSAEERAQYVKLIEDFDPEIYSLAQTCLTQGILQPVEVRESGSGSFTLCFGARRCLAVLYNWCLLGKPKEPIIPAFLTKGNANDMLKRGLIENIRKTQSKIDEAKVIRMAINNGEKKQDVASQLGMSVSTVESRLSLLDLDPKIQERIHKGEKVKTVTDEVKGKNGQQPSSPPMRKRKEVEAAQQEFAEGTKERKVLDWFLGLREKIS